MSNNEFFTGIFTDKRDDINEYQLFKAPDNTQITNKKKIVYLLLTFRSV